MKFTYPPNSQPLPGYTIKRAIHRGGFGEVYYALSDGGREVAMKLLQHNAEIELRGVQQCLNLSHPNLVTIFDIRKDSEGDWWVLMEYIAGDTLDAVLRRAPQGMPTEDVRFWIDGLAAGVGFLHERGIVHRDLKPANLFRDQTGIKIADVGLSKFISPSRRSAQTQSVGTVYYMAPEVSRGNYGKAVDLYALGVITFEMLTGSLPFDGDTTGEILMKHLTAAPELDRVPAQYRPALERALDKDPERRQASVQEFANEITAAIGGGTVVAPLTKPAPAVANETVEILTPEPVAPRPRGSRWLRFQEAASRRLSPAARRGLRQFRYWCVTAPRTVFSVGLLTTLLWLVAPKFFSTVYHPTSADPAAVGLFACSLILSAWAITAGTRIGSNQLRRLRMVVIGALVGIVVSVIQKFLLVNFISHPPLDAVSGIIDTLGGQPLMHGRDPTWVGHATHFAALFSVTNWSALTMRYRPRLIRFFPVLKMASLAVMLSALFAYAPTWALYHAFFLTAVVQLASEWSNDAPE